ncbi:MAG: GNAT family acetyltransferase [Actinomycetia bacterium]|nr:GNAT family acetyltransferase [Actinomycetes bacterium]
MRIRTCEPGDADAVIALWEACGLTRPWNDPHADIERKRAFQPGLFFVGATEDGEIIATVMAGYDGHRGAINLLAVDPARRGEGLGAALLAHAEAALAALGCPKINLQVRPENADVAGFYERCGYEPFQVIDLGKRRTV